MNCWMGERAHGEYLISAVTLHSTCLYNKLLEYVCPMYPDNHFVQQGLLLPSEIKKVTETQPAVFPATISLKWGD